MEVSKTSSNWAAMREKGSYWGLCFMLTIYRFLGRRTFSLMLYPVATYFFLMHKDARLASFNFLSRVFKQKQLPPPKQRDVLKHFIYFGEALIDKIAAWTGDINLNDISYENYEVFTRLREKNIGMVIISAHLGNVEVSQALGKVYRNLKINSFVYTGNARNFNSLLKKTNPESNISLMQNTDINPATILLLREKIKKGELVVLLGDRLPAGYSRHYSSVSFLGEDALFPHGPFILSSLLQCPVLLLFCVKQGGKYKLIFEPFADKIHLDTKDRAGALQKMTEKYIKRLEENCLEFPYQWFNFFDIWQKETKRGKE